MLLRLLVLASSLALAAPSVETLARSVTIYRDTYGVPHVYGPTDAACVFVYAYAQAEDNFWQIEDSYFRALGKGGHSLDLEQLWRRMIRSGRRESSPGNATAHAGHGK